MPNFKGRAESNFLLSDSGSEISGLLEFINLRLRYLFTLARRNVNVRYRVNYSLRLSLDISNQT